GGGGERRPAGRPPAGGGGAAPGRGGPPRGRGGGRGGVLGGGPAELVHAQAAHAGRRPSPDSSGRPSARLRFCTAWPAAPFTRLSRAEKTTTRPGAASCTEMWQSLVWVTSDRRGGPAATTLTNGSPS